MKRAASFAATASLLGVFFCACGSSEPARPTPGPDPVPDNTTFDVTWAPQSKVVDDAKSLLLSKDPEQMGMVTYHFKNDPRIAALQPGDIAVLGGIAYRRVVSVTDTGTELVLVGEHTKLTDAITKGKMTWDTAFDFTDPNKVKTMSVGLGDGIGIRDTNPGTLTYSGSVQGFDISLTFTPNGGRLDLAVTASKSIGGQKRIALTADGYIERFRNQGEWSWDGTDLQFREGTNQFHGELHVTFAAFNAGVSQDLVSIPLSISYPVLVGPVPLTISLKANINVTAALTLGEASSQAEVRMQFDTTQGVSIGASATPVGQLANPVLDVIDGGSASGVAAGLTGCVEFPRLEVGFLGEAVSVGVTQNNCASSVFTFDPPCQEVNASIVGKALYQVGFLGFSLADGSVELYNQRRRRGTETAACTAM